MNFKAILLLSFLSISDHIGGQDIIFSKNESNCGDWIGITVDQKDGLSSCEYRICGTDSIYRSFFKSGNISEYIVLNNSSGRVIDHWEWYDNPHVLKSTSLMRGQLMQGFYSNGLIKFNYACNGDTCIESHYYPNGELMDRAFFKNVGLDSAIFLSEHEYVLYREMRHPNGVVRFIDTAVTPRYERKMYDSEGNLRAIVIIGETNSWVGPYREYYANGTLRVKGQYLDAFIREKDGEWQYFGPNGELLKREIYLGGHLISEEIFLEANYDDLIEPLGH